MKTFLAAVVLSCISLLSVAQSNNAVQPFVLGEIRHIQSEILGEDRLLNIYLPEGYKQDDTTHYPVIYLLDGSANEDFIHIAGLAQFANFEWVNLLPKSIIVGIANVDRRRDFTFPTHDTGDIRLAPTFGGAEKFIGFIEMELQPFIANTYKINNSKTLIGQSLGGLLATEILYKKPYLFTDYIIVSASLWWDKESLLKTKPAILAADYKQPTSVYIAVGNERDDMVTEADKLYKILQSPGKKNLKLHVQHFDKENHATILHRAVYAAFEWQYPKS